MEITLLFVVLAVVGVQLLLLLRPKNQFDIEQFRSLLQSEFKENRTELQTSLRENREELAKGLEKLTAGLEHKLQLINENISKNSADNRKELTDNLKSFSEQFTQNVKDFNDLQKQKFEQMGQKQDELVKATELKLEKMRETVDEKLHKTLEERLGQSFKLVSERLEAVQKGLGEMQNLANGVGDLKKVLSNVKTRGVLGEIQLANILEQLLAPEQYDRNVKTKKGSSDHVEFAIKLPGKDDGQPVFLPIDAKFPQEDYIRLQAAFEAADLVAIDTASKSLARSVKSFAKSIRDKYIDPPHTTDFGILFFPIEGLFAEIVRQPDLVEHLQREYKIIVTGPTTLAAMLNSLQMGFKTLAIQKRSSEVWEVLGAVKTEFNKFGGVLEKAQKKISEANQELDNLVGTRTRLMLSKLKNVQELPSQQSNLVLGDVEENEERQGD
jgi:DNA recombination protein RmuC